MAKYAIFTFPANKAVSAVSMRLKAIQNIFKTQ
jgi:hypothetical protein